MSSGSFAGEGWLDANGGRDFPLVDDWPGSSWTHPSSESGRLPWRNVPKWLIRDFRALVSTPSRGDRVDPMCSVLRSYKVYKLDNGAVHAEIGVEVECVVGDPKYTDSFGKPAKAFLRLSADMPYGQTRTVRGSAYGTGTTAKGGQRSMGTLVSVTAVLGTPSNENESDFAYIPSSDSAFPVQFNGGGWRGIPFVPSRTVVIPGGMGVSCLVVGDKSATGTVHVKNGVQTTMRIYGNAIHLVAAPGVGELPDCEQSGEDYSCEAIHFINGAHADSDGSFQIVGGEGVSVVTGVKYLGAPAIAVVTNESSRLSTHYSYADWNEEYLEWRKNHAHLIGGG